MPQIVVLKDNECWKNGFTVMISIVSLFCFQISICRFTSNIIHHMYLLYIYSYSDNSLQKNRTLEIVVARQKDLFSVCHFYYAVLLSWICSVCSAVSNQLFSQPVEKMILYILTWLQRTATLPQTPAFFNIFLPHIIIFSAVTIFTIVTPRWRLYQTTF